jgi:uncharacterized protein (TIGR02300 family)
MAYHLGEKRQCGSCDRVFYDLNRQPICCPNCGQEYQSVIEKASVAPLQQANAMASADWEDEIPFEIEDEDDELDGLTL